MENLKEIKEFAHENHVPIMLDDGLEYLLKVIQEKKSKNILEIGTAIGYSAMKMAALDKEILIDTLEVDEERYFEAVENIKNNHYEHQIHVHLGDAMEFSSELKYDLIFVDAAKSQYRRYMEHFYVNLNVGGVYFFDNLNFHGFVDNPSLTQNRSTKQMCAKIKRFREWIQQNEDLCTEFHPEIGDGIAIVSVKKEWNMLK